MAINTSSFPYTFTMESDPPAIKMNEMLYGAFKSILFRDSLFGYFPYMQFTLNDDVGLFTETHFFTEGLNFKIKMGLHNDANRFMQHTFFLTEQQMNVPYHYDAVTGPLTYVLLSNFAQQDYVKSKSFQGNISDVVKQIMNTYTFPSGNPSLLISPTNNTDIWYQGEETDSAFISNLTKYALSSSSPNSPYYSFINLNGKFFFATADQLLSQNPVATLNYGDTTDRPMNLGAALTATDSSKNIRNFSFQFIGTPGNMRNYKKDLYSTPDTGVTVKETVKLSQQYIPKGTEKLPIRKALLEDTRDPKALNRDTRNFGIIDDVNQKNTYKGWKTNLYVDSLSFPFRMKIDTAWNPDLVAGSVIKTNFRSASKKRMNISREYSGNWLILESYHLVDQKGVLYTHIVCGRSTIDLHPDHVFYQQFL